MWPPEFGARDPAGLAEQEPFTVWLHRGDRDRCLGRVDRLLDLVRGQVAVISSDG